MKMEILDGYASIARASTGSSSPSKKKSGSHRNAEKHRGCCYCRLLPARKIPLLTLSTMVFAMEVEEDDGDYC